MRLFVAVKIPDDIKGNIKEIYNYLPDDKIKKVALNNLHYTLQFLGEVHGNEIHKITNALSDVKFNKFTVAVHGIGFFPNQNYVKVVWLGADDNGGLKELASKVRGALEPLGFTPDHSFSPHLTIARVKRKIETKELIKKFGSRAFGSFKVSQFYLIKSTLTPRGPMYEVIGEYHAKD
ncbi:RNA 2',3'-cyclic phosphodiesterase [Candidatus Micrarchaeota archaeon]|nr:RNA 2',3'-cyclic phosphodiesterase [Candidatus Micrarchaeota archaeon]